MHPRRAALRSAIRVGAAALCFPTQARPATVAACSMQREHSHDMWKVWRGRSWCKAAGKGIRPTQAPWRNARPCDDERTTEQQAGCLPTGEGVRWLGRGLGMAPSTTSTKTGENGQSMRMSTLTSSSE